MYDIFAAVKSQIWFRVLNNGRGRWEYTAKIVLNITTEIFLKPYYNGKNQVGLLEI